MDINEYNKIKDLDYERYCDYLQCKYGLPKGSYFYRNWTKNSSLGRSKEGLVCHHKKEDRSIMLSERTHAMSNPYEWQMPHNLVYCNYLEHLLLHIMISENPLPQEYRNKLELPGIGGALNFMIPTLNDWYAGCHIISKVEINYFNVIKDHIDTYLAIIRRLVTNCNTHPFFNKACLYSSKKEQHNSPRWSRENNEDLYRKFKEIINEVLG